MPKLETISDTASPAPWRRAWRRTNQLPMPASGASSTRLEISTPPISNGSVSAGWSTPFAPSTDAPGREAEEASVDGDCSIVLFIDDSQSFEGQEVVDLVNRLAERGDSVGYAAGCDQGRFAELVLDPPRQRVDEPG